MKTLIIVKPDWVDNRSLLSEIFNFIKENDLQIVLSERFTLKEDFWRKFYVDHSGTFYFEEMIKWMSSLPSLFLIIEGDKAVDLVRQKVVGVNGSGLRLKYQISELKNVVHASDSEDSAKQELDLVNGAFYK